MDTYAGFPAHAAQPHTTPAGTPVVFLHGAFADHTCFAEWTPRFAAAGHLAIAPSRRGRLGIGPDRADGLTFDDYVDDTLAVLDEIQDRPVLVGHSLGGLIAQRVAEQGRAAAVVLLASAPPAMLTAQPIALRHFAPNLGRIMSGRPFIVPDGACSVLALNDVPEADRPAIHARLTHESGRVYRAAMMGSIRVDASKVNVPVRVIGGADDRIISAKLVRKTAAHYGVDAELLDDHAHWLIGEPGWERIADDVLRWVGQVRPCISPA